MGEIMILGVHVSAAGNIYDSLERAYGLGCNTMQIFSRNPQRWRDNFLGEHDFDEFRKAKQKFKINPVFIHIPYLINLASPEPGLYRASIRAYIEDIVEADKLGADFIVTHMGSHKKTSESLGIKRLTAALNKIALATKDSKVGILLENTSGSGSWLGYDFTHHKRVFDNLKDRQRFGICLDTAHAFSAGYDISNKPGLDAMLGEIDRLVGLGLIRLIHLNDSASRLGQHFDKHQHIGKGYIGIPGMKNIINHKGLKDKPFILETPKEYQSSDIDNLETVRKLRK
ncbi:MAG: deoxyribonuclease IV [Candidatus Omnitrophota bacterium]|jgi:deoxyribonuclease-4|nr:MAG: deoxyribonuclease IV [Candidatus Omnitrophota bacterium]